MQLNVRRFAGCLASMASFSVVLCGQAQVEKIADLNFVTSDGIGYGGYAPLDRFAQVETNLWFTTSKGGVFDAGTISRFDLVSRTVVEVASFDNTTGKASESWLLPVGDEAYFTTVNGGSGNRGTIAKVHLQTGVITVVYGFPTNGLPTGQTPRAGLTRIGDELWTITSSGGSSNRGTIVRYSLTNGTTTLVANLDGPLLGGQAFSGFAPGPSNDWYFTTFTGGSTFGTPGLTLGAGTLGRLSFSGDGTPIVSKVADLTAGYPQFPALEPTTVGSDAVYFTTTGPNNNPGAIIRYQPSTGTWTNLFSFRTNSVDLLSYGSRPGYSGLVEWFGDLYFINRLGGTSNLGTVAKFSIANGTVTKLADLEGAGAQSLGSASGFFGTGTIVEETNRFYIYYPLTSGGANNRGTVIRVALPPPPIVAAIAGSETPGQFQLSWTGGYPPFTVESSQDLNPGSWTNVVATGLTNRFTALPASIEGRAFFRVAGSQ